ncbi:MAG TPA: LysR family transcriptional regulator [Burkholderiaceae bacterium]|nr:LysR family transcriptional regulator [Burkholderiaceae bacterium]
MQTTQLPLPVQARHPVVPRSDDDARLKAYNAVFSELGLRFRWNAATLDWMAGLDCDTEEARIAMYLETSQPHLLTAYDIDFLSHLIYDMKNKHSDNFGVLAAA